MAQERIYMSIIKKIPHLEKKHVGKRVFYTPSEDEKKHYNIIKKEIQNRYNIKLANRDVITKDLINIVTNGDHINYSFNHKLKIGIIRTDISNFFPSIDKHILYRKISNSNILSENTVQILKPLFFSSSVKGVPLGLPFSNLLAEIYLESFDNDIYLSFNPLFYFRYVDDIIIIFHDKSLNTAQTLQNELKYIDKLDSIFNKYHLLRNDEKTEISYSNKTQQLNFSYLGYHFKEDPTKKILLVDISEDKFQKVILKVKNYFYLYRSSAHSQADFWKLYYRLKHLIHGITSDDKSASNFQFGLASSYKFINTDTHLTPLIKTIKHYIVSHNLTNKQKHTLFSLLSYSNSSLELLKKKYNYQKLTNQQLKTIKKRLGISANNITINDIFKKIYEEV